jgi:very-short-patch-repair endonuclease
MRKSHLEERMAIILKTFNPYPAEREHTFAPGRKFRADFAYPEKKILIEVEGGLFMRRGGHNSISGISRDIEKYNLAVTLGWRVLRYTSENMSQVVNDLRKLW